MTENPCERGDALSAVKSGPLDWGTVWRLMLRALLNLLNASLTVLLLTACVIGVNQAFSTADSSQTASRDLLLSGLGEVSAIAMGVSDRTARLFWSNGGSGRGFAGAGGADCRLSGNDQQWTAVVGQRTVAAAMICGRWLVRRNLGGGGHGVG